MLRVYTRILEVRVNFLSSCRDHWNLSCFLSQVIRWKKG